MARSLLLMGTPQLTEEDIALVFARPDGRSKINKMFISMNLRPLFNVLGALLTLLGITMVVPIFISYFAGGYDLIWFIYSFSFVFPLEPQYGFLLGITNP